MAQIQRKTWLIGTIVVLGMGLVITGVTFALFSKQKAADSSSDTEQISVPTRQPTQEKTETTETDTTSEAVTKADPASLRSLVIEQLGVTVFYTIGTPAFEYSIQRTDSRTEYVQFTAAQLIGTKCTGDNGAFASIIKNPSSDEDQTTISQTVTVGDDTFGLSLSGAGCTADPELFMQYQTGFKNGFTSLQAL